MKKIVVILTICIPIFLLISCKKDRPIGNPIPIEPDYTLPQGGASQWAEDWIQTMHDTYGSYFLYKFEQKDFVWTQSTSSGSAGTIDSAVMLNPEHVEGFIKFLEEAWLNVIPANIKGTRMIPYRVFLVDKIKNYMPNAVSAFHPEYPYQYRDFAVKDNALIIAYTSLTGIQRVGTPMVESPIRKGIHELTETERTTRKIELIQTIFARYYNIQPSDDWYALTDYTNAPVEFELLPSNMIVTGQRIYNAVQDNPAGATYNAADTVLPYKIAYRNQGFLPNGYNSTTGTPNEWLTNRIMWEQAKEQDKSSYEYHLFRRTDAQMEFYLNTYPKIKEKWDALINFYKDFGVDVRAIANSTPAE